MKFSPFDDIYKMNINKWVYIPKTKNCMSKARVTNYAVNLCNSDNLLLLDDDNYLTSNHSIVNIINLFKDFHFIVGQIKDNNQKTIFIRLKKWIEE